MHKMSAHRQLFQKNEHLCILECTVFICETAIKDTEEMRKPQVSPQLCLEVKLECPLDLPSTPNKVILIPIKNFIPTLLGGLRISGLQ